MRPTCVLGLLVAMLLCLQETHGHGYISFPAARNSAWRYGFDNPINWTDDELNCGGFGSQWDQHGGKCGPCGDDYGLKRPRPNEAGGKYGNGILTGNFTRGQVVDIEIVITTNHGGTFEFKLCPTNDPTVMSDQSCLDQHPLQLADGSGTLYTLPNHHSGTFTIPVKMPSDFSCSYCVMQWWWTCANSWGECPDGSEGMGCGPQESFVNCADISVH
ncbi:uncharacterized protein LOC143040732 [Oratosquilla oratoria]|uniref:uncharacterized protein LOC143040732 n=1 Tax=Oratosquilla oratoria TaxID=337810 RepID=UPI003F76D32D